MNLAANQIIQFPGNLILNKMFDSHKMLIQFNYNEFNYNLL